MAIKLLIVDDSALMRRQLSGIFEDAGGFEVRLARNGREAIAENRGFAPDVVTLDINMPEMDGLSALAMLMAERPVPVVMVSSLTEKGALATFEALNLGAVDYVPKPDGTISLSVDKVRDSLLAKVRAAARARIAARRTASPAAPRETEAAAPAAAAALAPVASAAAAPRIAAGEGVVVIGVSTGGPRTLEGILPKLPAHLPWPVLVAQHMPAQFTAPFAQRLNTVCALEVLEVNRPMPIEPGKVYVAKGGADMVAVRRAGRRMLLARPEDAAHLWHPSVELLGRSVLEIYEPSQMMGVMLTGMGHDGADAFAEMKRRGARTIAESESTAVVFGMPGELIKRGGASVTLPAQNIAGQINAWLGC